MHFELFSVYNTCSMQCVLLSLCCLAMLFPPLCPTYAYAKVLIRVCTCRPNLGEWPGHSHHICIVQASSQCEYIPLTVFISMGCSLSDL